MTEAVTWKPGMWSKTTAHGKLALVEKNNESDANSRPVIGGRSNVATPWLLENTNLGALSENMENIDYDKIDADDLEKKLIKEYGKEKYEEMMKNL